MVNLLVTHHL